MGWNSELFVIVTVRLVVAGVSISGVLPSSSAALILILISSGSSPSAPQAASDRTTAALARPFIMRSDFFSVGRMFRILICLKFSLVKIRF